MRGSKLIKVFLGILLLGAVSFGILSSSAQKEAHAGVFSSIVSAFSDKTEAGTLNRKYNSQNSSALEAPLTPTLEIGGGDIVIVDNSALEYQSESFGANQSDQISTYVVREGDTLSSIAETFNVSVNTIIWANDITNNVIKPGQNLVILPITGIRHIVKAGDTIESIAKKHNGDIGDILSFNNISSDAKLEVGDEIIVPNGDAPSPAKSTTAAKSSATAKSTAGYYVRPISGGRKTQGIHGYNGVDLAAPLGTDIVASAAGRVIISRNSGYNGGYGNYVVISHPNGTQTLYAHLTNAIVNVGQSVSQGQVIGHLGNTGRSTGPHVHFEIRGAKNPF